MVVKTITITDIADVRPGDTATMIARSGAMVTGPVQSGAECMPGGGLSIMTDSNGVTGGPTAGMIFRYPSWRFVSATREVPECDDPDGCCTHENTVNGLGLTGLGDCTDCMNTGHTHAKEETMERAILSMGDVLAGDEVVLAGEDPDGRRFSVQGYVRSVARTEVDADGRARSWVCRIGHTPYNVRRSGTNGGGMRFVSALREVDLPTKNGSLIRLGAGAEAALIGDVWYFVESGNVAEIGQRGWEIIRDAGEERESDGE